ncbi:hypothetical protein LUZ63_018786 [Rhynchospora breviuscula]|uniref:GATA-type domain-containing protein n=1 Tax=Rhynchospora breviuscula TaxID=2022672 RepID=A0A9Q0C502_9POAL|nr:hypothetical protein LUZ63_018786 [Rhynchospora breviuscula]
MMVRPQIVLFGDAIVETSFDHGGWGASLSRTFSRKADVIVRGYDGYNTNWALFLLNQLFPLNGFTAPCATLIFFGANDSALLGRSSERQHVPQDQYKDNLKKIITHLKEQSPSMVVVLVTPLPVDELGREQHARSFYGEKKTKLPDRTNEMTGSYARQCLEVAREMHLPWIDLWFAMQQTSGWQKLFFDGSQLTEEGNAFIHKEVEQVLMDAGINAHNMQLDFPNHFDIDEANPENAFQQDFYSSHLVDLGYEEDFVAEMVIPSGTDDSKPISTPQHMGTAFEFDPILVPLPDSKPISTPQHMGLAFEFDPLPVPLPDDAFFPSSSCTNSSGVPSTSPPMAVLAPDFTNMEVKRFQNSPIIQIKEEPLSFVATSSSISSPKHIKEEHTGPTTPLKDEVSAGPAVALKKSAMKSKKRRSRRKAVGRPPSWLSSKAKQTADKMCMHCQTKKTPQWRMGPEGAKTLCNACGVRYRLGRLLPEYRPIGSPTFVPLLHSNSHKEVEKMRRLKDEQMDWIEC